MLSNFLPDELAALVRQELALGSYATEEEVLRDALRSLVERRQTHEDVEAGLRELAAGGGRPLEVIDAELRRTYGIADEP